jgi:hypothetical protein
MFNVTLFPLIFFHKFDALTPENQIEVVNVDTQLTQDIQRSLRQG